MTKPGEALSQTGPALLPMYDWPEVSWATDALWQAIRTACRQIGLNPPQTLTRHAGLLDQWLDPHLFLAQTCGLPFARHLRCRVRLLGSPAYALEGCEPGDYYSVVVVRQTDLLAGPDDIGPTHRFAYNGIDSQSGFRAMQSLLRAGGQSADWLASGRRTGSHRASIRAVADGVADFAAIDAISWLLAGRHEPASRNLRVLTRTASTPGLPFITSLDRDGAPLATAIKNAIETLEPRVREALGICGFRQRVEADYDCMDEAETV